MDKRFVWQGEGTILKELKPYSSKEKDLCSFIWSSGSTFPKAGNLASLHSLTVQAQG